MMKNNNATPRRDFLKNMALATGTGFFLSSFQGNPSKKQKEIIVGHGDFTYKVDKNWGNQDPGKYPVNHCHEMVQDSKKRLILLTNHIQNNILIYDKSGKITQNWTLKLPAAHGLTLSQEGNEEFLFITDTDLHQVYKTTMQGKVLLTIDYPKEIKTYEKADDFKPTEVAVAPNGDFYVADGYGKNFIIQYSPKGEYIRHFGGKGDNKDQFDCCHGVTLDMRKPENPSLLITSRSKQEFKRFTLDGKHLETISLPGCWICRPVIKGKYLYFAVIVTVSWYDYDGMVVILDENNRVVSLPGGSAPVYEGGTLQKPVYDGLTFLNPHDVCVDDEENLYVPQWYSGKTYPVKLERI